LEIRKDLLVRGPAGWQIYCLATAKVEIKSWNGRPKITRKVGLKDS